jgi:hypothetical protein
MALHPGKRLTCLQVADQFVLHVWVPSHTIARDCATMAREFTSRLPHCTVRPPLRRSTLAACEMNTRFQYLKPHDVHRRCGLLCATNRTSTPTQAAGCRRFQRALQPKLRAHLICARLRRAVSRLEKFVTSPLQGPSTVPASRTAKKILFPRLASSSSHPGAMEVTRCNGCHVIPTSAREKTRLAACRQTQQRSTHRIAIRPLAE